MLHHHYTSGCKRFSYLVLCKEKWTKKHFFVWCGKGAKFPADLLWEVITASKPQEWASLENFMPFSFSWKQLSRHGFVRLLLLMTPKTKKQSCNQPETEHDIKRERDRKELTSHLA